MENPVSTLLLTVAAPMKHQHMAEGEQVTTQTNPPAFIKPYPSKAARAQPGTSQISDLLGSDQHISRQAGERVERLP